jgi:hypothetical protein
VRETEMYYPHCWKNLQETWIGREKKRLDTKEDFLKIEKGSEYWSGWKLLSMMVTDG